MARRLIHTMRRGDDYSQKFAPGNGPPYFSAAIDTPAAPDRRQDTTYGGAPAAAFFPQPLIKCRHAGNNRTGPGFVLTEGSPTWVRPAAVRAWNGWSMPTPCRCTATP